MDGLQWRINPIKIDDLGVPLFQETSTSIASVLPLGDMPPTIDGQVRSYQWLLVDKLLNTPNIPKHCVTEIEEV